MAGAVLIDEHTLLLADGGRFVEVAIEDIASALSEPTDIAIVPCEAQLITAANEENLDRQILGQVAEGSVYCHRRIDDLKYQVFSMEQELLEQLRQSPRARAVVPYGVTVLNAIRSPNLSLVERISRVIRVGAESDELAPIDVVSVDHYLGRVVVTAVRGDEVRAVRVLDGGHTLGREIFVTLQGAGMPDSKVITGDRTLAEHIERAGQAVSQARIQAEAPSFAVLGLTRDTPSQFYLPAERARLKRQAVAQKERAQLGVVAFAFGLCCVIAAGTFAWSLSVSAEVKGLQNQLTSTEPQLQQLYQQRYAGFIAAKQFNLPQAWAEMQFMMPPQLEIERVTIEQGRVSATLKKRVLDMGATDPPLTLTELKAALERSPVWRGSNVNMKFDSHDMKFSVDKTR